MKHKTLLQQIGITLIAMPLVAMVVVLILASQSAQAHETRAAQRLESALSNISSKLTRIESKLRNLNGKIEELEKIAQDNEKNLKAQYADSQEAIKSLDRDVSRLKRAIKQLAERSTPLAQRKRKIERNNVVDLAKKNPKDLYNYGIEQLVTKRKYTEAQRAFELFVRQYPDNQRAGQALYWLGESFYARGNFRDAAGAYLRCYNSYPSGNKAPNCLLKLGTALAALHEWDEACSSFDKLRSSFPAAPPQILQKLNYEYERIQCGSDSPRG